MRRKIFEGNSWYSPHPLLSINFLATGNLLKHSTEGSLYEFFRHCEAKNFRRKLLTSPPVLAMNFFATWKFLKHSIEGFRYRIFQHCETQNFRGKLLILPSPPVIHKLFGYRLFSETKHRRVPLRSFSALSDKKFSTEPLDTHPPPPPLSIIFLATGNFLKQHRRVPLRSFSALWDKKFFRRKLLISPPVLVINFFATRVFLKHSTGGFRYQIFQHC